MDKYIKEAMRTFYSEPEGWTTDEIYEEYRNVCRLHGVEIRPKSVVIREICGEYNCTLEERVVKIFRRR